MLFPRRMLLLLAPVLVIASTAPPRFLTAQIESAPGNLQVTTADDQDGSPVNATIIVDGVPRDNVALNLPLPAGDYTLCFGLVAGYLPPPCQTVTVEEGGLSSYTGTFETAPDGIAPTGQGMLRVVTDPPVPSTVSVDGVERDAWGLAWLNLDPGSYTVSFGDVDGFQTPSTQVVSVTGGVTTTVTGRFVEFGAPSADQPSATPHAVEPNAGGLVPALAPSPCPQSPCTGP